MRRYLVAVIVLWACGPAQTGGSGADGGSDGGGAVDAVARPDAVDPNKDEDGDGYTVGQGDCDDTDRNVNPGAAEACDDHVDNDCDGITDADCTTVCDEPATPAGEEAVLAPDFRDIYRAYRLGPVPGVTTQYLGGMTISYWDDDILLVAVYSEDPQAKIYQVGIERGPCGHVLGFRDATPYADAPYVDANLVYAPHQVLLYTEWPVKKVGQLRPGDTAPARESDVSDLATACNDDGPGGLGFVPPSLGAAGEMRLVTWKGGCWFHMDYTYDGSLYVLSSPVAIPGSRISGGPGGFAYVPAGSPGFSSQSVIMALWSADKVVVFEVDDNGDPQTSTQRDFFTSFPKPWGAYFDKVSGDFFFLTWGGQYAGQVYVVQGFAPPPPPPE